MLVVFVLAALVVGPSSQSCVCKTIQWADCQGNPCSCSLLVGNNTKQILNCTTLIPKCLLMKAEMYRAKKGLDTRTIGGKPLETSFIYNPECENDGTFKAKQCNDSSECWCVNSAGFSRICKGDKDLKCEELVKTNKVHLNLIHKSVDGEVDAKKLEVHFKDEFHKRYNNFIKDIDRMLSIEYHPKDRWIAVVVKELEGVENTDLTSLAYYIENDVKLRPLFETSEMFEPTVGTIKLELKEIKVFSTDEKPPTFCEKPMSDLKISIFVLVPLIVAAVIAWICISLRRRRQERRQQPRAYLSKRRTACRAL